MLLTPSPCHKLSHLLGPPPPSSMTYFMDGPLGIFPFRSHQSFGLLPWIPDCPSHSYCYSSVQKLCLLWTHQLEYFVWELWIELLSLSLPQAPKICIIWQGVNISGYFVHILTILTVWPQARLSTTKHKLCCCLLFLSMKDHVVQTVIRCFHQLHLMKGCISSLWHGKTGCCWFVIMQIIAVTVCLCVSCILSSMLWCTDSQFLFVLSLKPAYWSFQGAVPGYLRDYCMEMHSFASGLLLWSKDKCQDRWKFSLATVLSQLLAFRCWNRPPPALCVANSVDSFKTGPKTSLFISICSVVSSLQGTLVAAWLSYGTSYR